MRRRLPRLALLALTLVALSTGAFAQEESIRLEAIRERISQRLEFAEGPNGIPVTKAEKRCQQAFEKAEAILEKGPSALPEEAKALKKIAVALNRWFGAEPDTARAFGTSAGAIDNKLVLDFDRLTDLIGSVTPQQREALKKKDLKRLQKFLDQVDKKRGKAADAAAAGNLKKQAGQLFGAVKAGAKAVALGLKLFPDPPPPVGGGEFLAVTTGIDLSGVRQAYALFTFPEDDDAAPVETQLSQGASDVSQVRSITSIGNTCALWLQGGDLQIADVGDPGAGPINLTSTVPPVIEEPYRVSASGDDVVVVAEDGIAYAVDVATGNSFPVGPARTAGTWFQNGARSGLILESSTFSLTAYVLDATGVTETIPFAASGGSAVPSPDGRFIAYSGPPPFGGGMSCYIYDRTNDETLEVAERHLTMDSGGDFRTSRQVAVAWASAGTCLVATTVGLQAAVHDPGAPDLTFDVTNLDPSRRDYAVCEVNAIDALLADTGGEIVHIDLATMNALFFSAKEPRSACAYDPGTRQVLYGKTAPDGAPEIHRYSCETGDSEFVFRPEADPAKYATTFLRDCDLTPAGDDLAFSFNVVGNNDAVGGIYQGLLTRPLDPDPATLGPVRTMPQHDETSFDTYAVAVFLIVADQLHRSRSVGVLRDFSVGGTENFVGGSTLTATGPAPIPVKRAPSSDQLAVRTETTE